MLTQNWLDALRMSLSHRQTKNRGRRSKFRASNSEGLEDRTLLSAPYSSDDSYTAVSGQTLTVSSASGVLANDMDMDFDPLTAQLMSPPMMGSLTLSSNGSFVYAAPSAFTGNVTFTYRAFDGTQTGNTATVTIGVSAGGGGGGGGTNLPPVAVTDSFYAEQNSSGARLPVLWNDSDPEDATLSIPSVTTPQHGSGDGQFDYYSGKNIVSYTPTSAYTGTDTFNYTITDGTLTATATTSLTVHPVDNTISSARSLTLQDNVRLTTGGIIGDGPQSWSDVDIFSVSLTAGQAIKFDIDSAKIDAGGSYGTLNALLRLFNSAGTQIALNDNGTDPDTNIASNDPYLTYTVTTSGTYYLGVSESTNSTYDPTTSGGGYSMISGAYQLRVLREVPNLPPVAAADTATTHFGTLVTIPVLANDTDPNGDVLTLTSAGSASHGTTQIVTVNSTSQIRYTPTAGYVGSDSFSYIISDPFGATSAATVSVSVTNTNPVAVGESYEAVAGVSRVVAASGVLANDTDADFDSLTTQLVTVVAHGTLTLNANGSFTYLATSGYLGSDSFVYRANDGAGNSANTTVSISVYPTNVTAFAESYSIGHDKTLTVATPGVLANDWDFEHQTLTAILITSPAHGTLTLNANGSFVYVPAAGYVGADSFVYKATDGTNQSAAITVPLSVTNFAPWSVNDYYTVSHDRVLTRTAANGLLANDVDVEDDLLTVSLVTGPGTGTLVLNANGSFDYTPVVGATGTVTFTYKISDGFNFSQNATASISIVNSAPTPSAELLSTPSGTALAISLATLLANDVDADGDTMILAIQSGTTHGTLTTQLNGSLLYQPNAGFSGTDTFHYTLTDGLATSAPVEVRIRVNNAAPLGIADFYSVSHDRPLVVTTNSVVVNDVDDDDDPLTVVLESAPATGILLLHADGTFVFTPAAGAVGDVTFTYRVTDGIVTSSPIVATIHVTNAAPIGRVDAFIVHQGQTLVVPAGTGLLQNDSDADSDPLTVSLQAGPTHGTLALAANGSFTFAPTAGFAGSDSFTYRVTDGIITSSPITVSLTVSNIHPSATANSYVVLHDQLLVVPVATGVVANDFDVDDDTLTAAVVTGPGHGSLVLQPDGSFSFTPTAGFVGNDTFVYRVSDGAAFSDSVSVTINVTNQRPWTVNRSFAVLHDHSLIIDAPGLFAFSGDGDSDVLTIVAGVAPTHGTVTLNANGSFAYIPAVGFVGTDSFGYRMSDGVSQSDVSEVSILVFNSAPLTTADYYTISHDRTLTIGVTQGVLSNDQDLDVDILTATVVTGHGVQHGTLTFQTNGSFVYVATVGYVGTDTFRYRITDGAQTAEADVTITVVNQRPVADNDKYGATVEQLLSVTAAAGVLSNDMDPDLDVLQAVLYSGPSHGTLSLSTDGSFSYLPNAGFIGVDEFRYEAKDTLNLKSFIRTVSISTALVATNDDDTVSHDRTLTGNVGANDHGVSGTAPTYVLISGPASGTFSLNASGAYTFTPASHFVGLVTFNYLFQANGHDSNVATATIHVVNEAPLVFTGTWRASHGHTITAPAAHGLAFRSRDRDSDALTFSVVQQPTHGTLTLQVNGSFLYAPTDPAYTGPDSFTWKAFDGLLYSEVKTAWIELLNHKTTVTADSYETHSGHTLTVTAANGVLSNDYDGDEDTLQAQITVQPTHGTVTLAANGSFVYTPHAGTINAADAFKYKVFDGAELSAEGTVSVRIANAVPQVLPEQFTVQHDRLLTVTVARGLLANDYDGDQDSLSAVIAVQPSHGSVTLAADGSLTFMPTAGYVGTDSFTYRVSDGFQQSDPVTVSLTVTNKAPVATNDHFITRRNTNLVIAAADVTGNDSDADADTVTLLPFGTPGHGTLTASGNGQWTYHPNAGFVGMDSVSYQVSDGVSTSVTATLQIDVLNSAPVAAGDRFEVPHDLAFVVAAGKIQTNDFDLEGDSLTVSIVENVRNGTLVLQSNGGCTYTPNAGFIGRDTFSYRLYDGNLYSEPVRVILDVVNHRPVARDGSQRITHDTVLTQPATSGLLSGARDTDDDSLTASIVSTVHNGALTVQANGSWTYTPATHFVGTDSFTYRVSDGSLQSLTKTISIDVSNTPVVASMDAWTVTPNTALSVAAPGVLQNDSDIDGDTLTLTVVDNVLHGTLSLQQTGSFVYTPTTGYIGQDSFTYKVSDGLEETTATVQLTVTGIPQTTQTVPVARNDFYRTPHSTLLTVSASAGLLGNDRDPNNDPLTVQLVAGPGHGTLTLNTNGSFTFQPFAGNSTTIAYVGTDTFTYRTSDGSNLSAVTTAEIKVRNTLPWAANAAFETHQGTTLTPAVGQLSRFAGDNDHDVLTFTVVTNPQHGTLTLNSDGTFSFVPATGYSGTDSFTWRVSDKIGNSQSANVSIDVTNERPTAFDLQFTTQHGQVYNGTGRGVMAGASDQDNDTLTAQLVTGAAHGTVVVNSNGTFIYTPTSGYAGNDQFVFRVSDGALNSYDAIVRLTVDNQSPVASDGYQSTQHDQPAVIELNAFDSDGDSLVYELVSAPQHGTLTYENLINSGSNGQPIRFTGKVTFHPTAGFVGDDTFQYRVNDGVTNSDPAEVSLSVRNFAPRGAASFQRTTPGNAIIVTGTGLLASASDPDGDTLTLSIVTQPTHGTLTLVQTNGVHTGGYTYTPNAGYAGPDSFSWRVSDGATVSDTVTVAIEIQNNAPTIADRSFQQRYREATVNGSGQRTYTVDLATAGVAIDADKDALQYQIVTNGQHGTATLTTQGLLKWTSTSNTYVGNDKIIVRVTDGYSFSDNAEITIAVDNTKPTAAGDFYSIHHNATLSITPVKLLGNDFDFDGDTLHIVSMTNGAHGTLTQSGDNWTFNPQGWAGTTELTYIVSDGLVNSEPATIEIEVTNAPVWGIDRSFTVGESGSIEFEISTTAGNVWSPDGDAVTVSFTAQPSHGTLTSLGNSRWKYTPTPGVPSGNGNMTHGYLGHDSLTFMLSDGQIQSPSIAYSFNVVDNAGKESNGLGSGETGLPGLWKSFLDSPAGTPLSAVSLPLVGGLQVIQMRPAQTVTRSIGLQNGVISGVTVDSAAVNAASGNYSATFAGGNIYVTSSGQVTIVSVGSGGTKNRVVISVLQNGHSVDFAMEVVIVNHAPLFGTAVFSGTSESAKLASYASDPDGDSLSFGQMPGSQALSTTLTNARGTLVVATNGDLSFQNLQPVYVVQEAVSFVVPVYDAYGLQTSQTVTFVPFHVKAYPVPPDYPATETSPVAVNDVFYFVSPYFSMGSVLTNDVKRGPGPWTATLLSGTEGTMGRIAQFNADGSVYYLLKQWYEEPFLNEPGEPTVFYYAITNGLGESDVGSFRIDKTVIGMGGGAGGIASSARSMQDGVAVAFDGTFPTWITRQTPGGNYVIDQFSANSSKVYWSGNTTANLSLNLEGTLESTIRNSGTLRIRSYSINQPVFASAFTSIEGLIHIEALFATGSGTSIWTAVETGPLLVAGNVQQLHLGYYNDLYGSGNIASLQWRSPILIGGNLDWTWVYGNLTGLMTVGGKIGRLLVTHDISGSVIAGDSISDCFDIGYTIQPFTSGSISGYVYAGNDIPQLTTGSMTGLVATGRDIGLFTLTSMQGTINAGRDLNTLEISEAAAGNIKAGRNIGRIQVAAGDLLSSIHAGLNIGLVTAFGDIAGVIMATAGSIMSVRAGFGDNSSGGNILSNTIMAGISIGRISARKQGTSGKGRVSVPGGITATAGYVGSVTGDEDITATIKASDDITNVSAGTFIVGDIDSANGSILTVSAGTGRVEGEIKANKNIGTVTTFTDRLGNTTSTTGSITSVTATQGQILGSTTAHNTLGTVSAGTDITGNVTATIGSITEILAGTYAPGNISGDISAGQSVLIVDARGKLPPALDQSELAAVEAALRLLEQAIQSGDTTTAANIVIPDLPDLAPSIKGDISGTITASELIGSVVADGEISGEHISAKRVNSIWAYEDISATINSTVGGVAVTTFGALQGDIHANRSISAFAYDDAIGDLVSDNGSVSIQTLGYLDGEVTAKLVAKASAFKDINGSVDSRAGIAIAATLHAIRNNVVSTYHSFASARTFIQGDVLADGGYVTTIAGRFSGTLSNLMNTAENPVSGYLSSFADRSDATGGARLEAPLEKPGDIVGNYTKGLNHQSDATSNVSITAGGRVALNVFHSLNVGDIIAGKDISIRAWAGIQVGTVSSEKGGIYVEGYDVSGSFDTGRHRLPYEVNVLGLPSIAGITVFAWGTFAGSVNVISGSALPEGGSASITAMLDANIGSSTATKRFSVFAGGNVSGTLASGDRAASISSAGSINVKNIKSRGGIYVSAVEAVTADISAVGATMGANGKVQQNVFVSAGGKVTGKVKSGGHTLLDALGGFAGTINSGGFIRLDAGADTIAVLKSDDDTIQEPYLRNLHEGMAITVTVVGSLTGGSNGGGAAAADTSTADFDSKGRIAVLTFGAVTGSFNTPDSVSITAHVGAETVGSIVASSFDGTVTVGGKLDVLVAGNIKAMITAESGVNLAAHGMISDTAITMGIGKGDVNVGADDSVKDVTITNAAHADISTINSIEGLKISKGDTAEVHSHFTVNAAFESVDNVSVYSRKDVDVTGKKILTAITVMSFDGNAKLKVEESTANVFGQAYVGFDGSITTTGNVDIKAIKTIKGNISGAEIDLTSLESIDGTVTGTGSVYGYGTTFVAGKLESTRGTVVAGTIGGTLEGLGISAEVIGFGDVNAWALAGSVSGKVTSSHGSVDVLAKLNLAGEVSAFGDATVEVGIDVTKPVTGGRVVIVTAYRNVDGAIKSTGGNVDIWAGVNVNGAIEAAKDIDAATLFGSITGAVTSTWGNIDLESGFDVSGIVWAGFGSLDVYAVNKISKNLTALLGSVDAYALIDGITGEVWATGNVDLNANESITGKVTSLGDVHIDTWKSSKGDVSASRDITVNAGFSITGSLTAGRNVKLWSGSMTSVTLAKATTGDVDAETWGIFKGEVQAPAGMVSIWSASDTCETTITSHDTVSVYSYGKVSGNITTAADAYVFGNGDVSGIINAVSMIDVGSYGNVDIQPTTAGTADIYSLGNTKVVGDADKGFTIISDGSLEIDVMSVDGDVITWSLDETRGSIEAGKYADSVSWGTTNLDTKGEDGAYVWSYGNLSGKLTSLSGYAIGISLWNNSADYDSYIFSAAIAGANISGMVHSDGDAFAFAAGNISSPIVWGIAGDAIALSFGTVSSHVSAGDVAVVVAAQNVTNIVHGDYAAVAFAGDNLFATVTSDGNVWLAAAGGNITGAIKAHDTVWDVFAWGSINATISAGDETGGTGVISSVQSIGPISGQIIATSSIGAVRSGSTVTATLTAPLKPVPIQNDAAVAQENPPLGVWDSGIVDIRIAVAARRAEWVTKREEAVAARDADLDELTDERTAQLNRLAAGYSDRKQEGLSVVIPNRFDELILEQSQFDTRMIELRAEQTSEDQYLWAGLHRLRAEAATARLTALQNAAIAYGNSVTAYQQTIGALNMQKEQIAINRAASIKNLEDAKKSFDAEAPTVWKQTKDWAAWGGTMLFHVTTLGFFALDGRAEHGRQLGDVLGADGGVDAADYVTIVAYSFEDFAGGLSWYKSYTGVDPLTGVELSDRDRKFGYVFGALEFASAVGAVVFIAGGFRVKPPNCFVGDTPIVIGLNDTATAFAVHPPVEATNNSPWAAVCILLGAFTGVAVLVDERRKRNVLHPAKSLVYDFDGAASDHLFQDADTLTLLSEPVSKVSAVGGKGSSLQAELTTDSDHRTSSNTRLLSLLPRSSGKKVADEPDEEVAVDSQPQRNSRFSGTLKAVSIISLLLGLWLGFGGRSIDSAATMPAVAEAVASPASAPKYKTVAIREIQPAGYKVLAENPQTPGQAAGDFGEFDPKTWQVHRFLMTKPDGGWLRIGLARPMAWIESVERNDSGKVWLEFEELGIADWVTLQKSEPCPKEILGEGRLVTGTFEHSSGEVLNLFIAGEATPIGTTAGHFFWSEDRHDFVQAANLRYGEELRLADGRLTHLEHSKPIAEQLPVFNLEVDGEHVYYVGESGTLVHNTSSPLEINLKRMGVNSRARGTDPSRVYTIYVDGTSVAKFGVTGADGNRLSRSLREMKAEFPARRITHTVTGEMTKREAHLVEKYFRSLHDASTGHSPLRMINPYPIRLKDLPEFQIP